MILLDPIEAHGSEITTLEFRKPNGADIRACGVPFSFQPTEDGGIIMHPNAGPISAMISRLCNIPPSSVGMLSAPDWQAASMELLSFFGASRRRILSDVASTSPGSGNGIQQSPSN